MAPERSQQAERVPTAAPCSQSGTAFSSSQPLRPAPAARPSAHAAETRPPWADNPGFSLEYEMVKVAISYLQVVSVVRDVDLRLPPPLSGLVQAQGAATGWARLLAWDCLALRGFEGPARAVARVAAVFLLPVAFGALFGAFWVARWAAARAPRPAGYLPRRLVVTGVNVAFLFYPTVSAAALSVFACLLVEDAAGNASLLPFEAARRGTGQLWSLDTSVQCWTGTHRCAATPARLLAVTR